MGKNGSLSIFVDVFIPQNPYSIYHKCKPTSCRNYVKRNDDHFQPGNAGNGIDPSNYRGGPSPFKDYDYDNTGFNRHNVVFKPLIFLIDMRKTVFIEQLPRIKNSRIKLKTLFNYQLVMKHRHIIIKNVVRINATNNEYISIRNARQAT